MNLEVKQVFPAAAPVRPLRGLREIVSTARSVGVSMVATYKDTEAPIFICHWGDGYTPSTPEHAVGCAGISTSFPAKPC